jgi:hypothetical protein
MKISAMAFDDFGKNVETYVANQEPHQALFKAQGPIWIWVKGSQCAQLNSIGSGHGILHLWRNVGRETGNARRSPMPFMTDLTLPEVISSYIVGWLHGIDPSEEMGFPVRASSLAPGISLAGRSSNGRRQGHSRQGVTRPLTETIS